MAREQQMTGEELPEAGSQVAVPDPETGIGEEDAHASESIEIDGEEVLVSDLRNGLKLHREFTKRREEEIKREREIEQRELELAQQAAILGPAAAIAEAMKDPVLASRISEVAPELSGAVGAVRSQAAFADEVEKLGYRMQAWAATNDVFTAEEKRAISIEALNRVKDKAARGDFSVSDIDPDSIGQALYRDAVVQREAKKLADEAALKAQRQLDAGVAPGGVAAPPRKTDTSKLSPKAKLAYGRKQRQK